MDQRERFDDPEEMLRTALEALQSKIWTAIPCRVVKDSDGHTVALQPLIKSVVVKPDGTREHVSLPEMHDVPVQFPSGGGTTMTFPIKTGQEVMAVISCRPMDAWHQQGGEQQQIDARMHDLSDAMCIPGIRSTPKKLSNVSTTSAQLRSDDGNHVVDLHPTNGISHTSTQAVNIKAPAGTFEVKSLTVKGGITLNKAADGTGGWLKAQTGLQAPIVNGSTGIIPD